MKNIKIRITVFIVVFFANSFCENVAGFDFLNLPQSARSASMGNISLIGEAANILAIRNNPAMLSQIKKNAVEIDFSPIILDIYSGGISTAINLKNKLVVSPSISYITFGAIDAVDGNGDNLNTQVSPFGISLDCAVSYRFFDRLNFGARLKFAHERITKKSTYWNDNYCSGVALDLGIFSDYNFFRYAAGFRNIGFSSDNYENIDIKFPASAFTAIGVIIEKEAQINWFLECEKYVYDYMFFRTGFEFPLFRDAFLFRVGTNFSPNDARYLFSTFGKNTPKSWEYSSEIWTLATIGATINAKINSNLMSLDIACQFRKDGITPGLLFSGTMYF